MFRITGYGNIIYQKVIIEGNKMGNEYFLGLDCGTGSVGWAVTDKNYRILRFHGKSMWGSRLFENANTAADRRATRCARRRYGRQKQRIELLNELFKNEISQLDPGFFARLDDSGYVSLDKRDVQKNSLFNDKNFKDKDFFRTYPTIFHLRKALIDDTAPVDVRLLYLAIHQMYKNRGHFLFQGQTLSAIQSVRPLIDELCLLAKDVMDLDINISDKDKVEDIIKRYKGNQRVSRLEELITTNEPKQLKKLLKALAGQKVSANSLFDSEDLVIDENEIKIDFQKSDFDVVELAKLEELLDPDSYHIVELLKGIYDWALLSQVMAGYSYLSYAKVDQFNANKEDLKKLKYVFKTYFAESEYEKLFHSNESKSFSSYIGTMHDQRKHESVRRCSVDDFYKTIRQPIEKNIRAKEDPAAQEILDKIANGTFLNLLISPRNSLIPYQVHMMELEKILSNAEKHYPFLSVKDKDGLSVSEKLKSIMTFRIPYYVGPLVDQSKGGDYIKYAWMERKEEGKIYPWNFDKKVDVDASAEKFIMRMVNDCTYLPGEKVLPKNSFLYSEFMVLNELNNLKINGQKPTVEQKQVIVEGLFKKRKKVTQKMLLSFVRAEGWYGANEKLVIEGIDGDFKSAMTTYIAFKPFLDSGKISVADAEKVIYYDTVFEAGGDILDKKIDALLSERLSNQELKSIKQIKATGWGRFSSKFLTGIQGTQISSGEMHSIMYYLRNTNRNLMELLSSEFDFVDIIEEAQSGTISDLDYSVVDKLAVSPSVKRQIWQTFKVVKEVEHVMGNPPRKVFMEFAREEGEKKRTVSRKNKLIELYDSIKNPDEDDLKLREAINGYSETQIAKNDRLYLYFLQKGRCMYSQKVINIEDINNNNIYDIDHIVPQSKVKDDSIHNRVLVLRHVNEMKSDNYPLSADIQNSRKAFWQFLKDQNLISESKLLRLTRTTPLLDSELADFINRQLVETRQSTKACAQILKKYFGEETKIVYSKAGNVSDFKNAFRIPKVRMINDLHHAKDAYLNIVVGNCYDTKFSRKGFIESHEKYNLSKLFNYAIPGAWNPEDTIVAVKKTLRKNDILFTRQTFCKSGKLFDLMPLKGNEKNGMLPRKSSDYKLIAKLAQAEDKQACVDAWVKQYGGYNSLAVSYFALVQCSMGKKEKVSMIGIPVMLSRIINSKESLQSYLIDNLHMNNPKVLINRVPINTLMEYNGFKVHLSGKTGNGLLCKSAVPLYLNLRFEQYAKNIEKANNRRKNIQILIDLFPKKMEFPQKKHRIVR
jgi:CRISPR-associated protein Cas9/Csn1, subtype II/NMEMI